MELTDKIKQICEEAQKSMIIFPFAYRLISFPGAFKFAFGPSWSTYGGYGPIGRRLELGRYAR